MIANMHKWEIPGIEQTMTPPFPSIRWADRVVNNSNIAARRETLQEKDTKKEHCLGEDLRKQVVEFVDKGAARVDKERSRWREALDRDTELRIPRIKFWLLLKAKKEKRSWKRNDKKIRKRLRQVENKQT